MLSPQTQIVTKRELSMHFKEVDNTKTTRTLSIQFGNDAKVIDIIIGSKSMVQ
jgi:hypothetical protein